jgi:hypothetical protein
VQDPWIFRIRRYLLCGAGMAGELNLRIHPPTARVGVLYIDGGGTRRVVPLKLIK